MSSSPPISRRGSLRQNSRQSSNHHDQDDIHSSSAHRTSSASSSRRSREKVFEFCNDDHRVEPSSPQQLTRINSRDISPPPINRRSSTQASASNRHQSQRHHSRRQSQQQPKRVRLTLSTQEQATVAEIFCSFVSLHPDETFITTQFLTLVDECYREHIYEAKNRSSFHELELRFLNQLSSLIRDATETSSEMSLFELEAAVLESTALATEHENWTCDDVLRSTLLQQIQQQQKSQHNKIVPNELNLKLTNLLPTTNVENLQTNSKGNNNDNNDTDWNGKLRGFYSQPTPHSPPPLSPLPVRYAVEDDPHLAIHDTAHSSSNNNITHQSREFDIPSSFSKQDTEVTMGSFNTTSSNPASLSFSFNSMARSTSSGIIVPAVGVAAIVESEDEARSNLDKKGTDYDNTPIPDDIEQQISILFSILDIRKTSLAFTSIIAHTITSVLAQNTLPHDHKLFLVEMRERFECNNTLELATDTFGAPTGLMMGKKISSTIDYVLFRSLVHICAAATRIELEDSVTHQHGFDLLGILQTLSSHASIAASQAILCLEALLQLTQRQAHQQPQLDKRSLSSSRMFRRLNIFGSKKNLDNIDTTDIPKSPMSMENLRLGTKLVTLERKPSKTALRDQSKKIVHAQTFLVPPDGSAIATNHNEPQHVMFVPSPVFVRKMNELNRQAVN